MFWLEKCSSYLFNDIIAFWSWIQYRDSCLFVLNCRPLENIITFIIPFNVFKSLYGLKGIVHPKMKILSSFTHPQVIPNLYECLCSAEHKGRYSEECGKQSSSGAPLTSIVFFFLLWKSMVPQNSLVTNFLQNIFLCARQNKEIHTGLELLEGE